MRNWMMLVGVLVGAMLALGSPWSVAAAMQEPAAAVPVDEPQVEAVAEPADDAVADAVMEAVQGALEALAEPADVPPADPTPVTLADVVGSLNAAIQSSAGTGAEVGLAGQALADAEAALAAAQSAHESAMGAQEDADTAIRAAARALVDFLTETYLTE